MSEFNFFPNFEKLPNKQEPESDTKNNPSVFIDEKYICSRAMASDENGSFHVNEHGKPAYSHRFYAVYPFKENGQATVLVEEQGKIFDRIIDIDGNFVFWL